MFMEENSNSTEGDKVKNSSVFPPVLPFTPGPVSQRSLLLTARNFLFVVFSL